MAKKTVPQQIEQYIKKHPEVYTHLFVTDMNEIRKLGNMVDIISVSFAYGYMKAKKGGTIHE